MLMMACTAITSNQINNSLVGMLCANKACITCPANHGKANNTALSTSDNATANHNLAR